MGFGPVTSSEEEIREAAVTRWLSARAIQRMHRAADEVANNQTTRSHSLSFAQQQQN